jgi:hypothetical protein
VWLLSLDIDNTLSIDYKKFVSKLNIDSFANAYEKIKKAKNITEPGRWQVKMYKYNIII